MVCLQDGQNNDKIQFAVIISYLTELSMLLTMLSSSPSEQLSSGTIKIYAVFCEIGSFISQ